MSTNSNFTRRRLLITVAILAALAFAFFVFHNDDAAATEPTNPKPCVSTPAIPAVPGTPAVPEVTKVVHHEAVYAVEYHFRKYTHTKTKPKNGDWSDYGPWTAYEPEQHTSWEDSSSPLGSPQFHGDGTYQDGTKWYREWQAQHDGKTRKGKLITAAWDETVVVTPAVPEVPGVPEVPAVVCPEVPTDTPTVPTQTPTVPTQTPTVPAETPTVPPTVVETPTVPTETPVKEKEPKKSSSSLACIDGVWVTTVDGQVISKSGSCGEDNKTVTELVEVNEEGM